MEVYKHRIFHQWSKSEGLKDETLIKTIDEINNGLYDANLGSGLYKKRVAMKGRGKRGSYRTLIAFIKGEKAYFIYGFSKNNLDDIDVHQRELYRKLAKNLLNLKPDEIKRLLETKKLFKVI